MQNTKDHSSTLTTTSNQSIICCRLPCAADALSYLMFGGMKSQTYASNLFLSLEKEAECSFCCAHERVGSLQSVSTFYKKFYKATAICIDWLEKDAFGNVVLGSEEGVESQNVRSIGFLHLIEHGFRVSAFKQKMMQRLVEASPNQSFVLIIDVVSCWDRYLSTLNREDKNVTYMNSASLLHFESLINFLVQLNESPKEALSRCQNASTLQYQLAGIVIDNISYYTHDGASYELLFKVLRMLRAKYGCFVMTVGYGLDFYSGVEQQLSSVRQSYDIPTRLPMSYVKNMDCVLLRDTDKDARVVYVKNSLV